MAKRLAKKVLLVGWDAADWKIIHPLLDAGKMPALEGLLNKGVMGNLATLEPVFSPMLWSSIATGKTADKHGILGFTEVDPQTGGICPVFSTSRKVKALWNIFMQSGLRSHVVGWWPSHPAEPINGITISNFYQKVVAPIDKPWPMQPGTVHPKEMEEVFKSLRIHPGELTDAHVLPFVPKAADVEQDEDKNLVNLTKILANCSTIHAAATWILENEEWDFMAVYYDAIDHFGHAFMKFHPPRMPGIPEKYFELYKDVVTSGYIFHDMMLERLLSLAGPETTVMLISDHGFHSDHLRPHSLPKEPAAPALEHSPYGILCMKGDGIKKDERIHGASLLDIAPTLLTLFGLPVGEDMDGHALVQAFEEETLPETIPSWEDVPGDCGMHPPRTKVNNAENQQMIDQLVELGYIEKPDENKQRAITQTSNESQYNLARVYLHSRKFDKALPILEKLHNDDPEANRYALRLASCYQHLKMMKECRETIMAIRKTQEEDMPSLDLLEGTLLLGENKPRKAIDMFRKVEQKAPDYPKLHVQMGRSYSLLKQWDDAERAFRKTLAQDPDNTAAHHGLAICFLRRDQFRESIEHGLNAIGLQYHFPFAHYHLGEALEAVGEYEHAANAFEVCLTMSPNINKARHWLIRIYENELGQKEKAAQHRKVLEQSDLETIYIVSGLPRSGTSMMMQMLEQGGMEIFTDKIREPDQSNPKGYYEHEAVKRLMRDKSWLPDARNKTVKVISELLLHLPPRYRYKVIFMMRDIKEVVLSQQKMLERTKKAGSKDYPAGLELAFTESIKQVEKWAALQPNVDILYVAYQDILSNPEEHAKSIADFLQKQLDTGNMIKAVDRGLYRTRHESLKN